MQLGLHDLLSHSFECLCLGLCAIVGLVHLFDCFSNTFNQCADLSGQRSAFFLTFC